MNRLRDSPPPYPGVPCNTDSAILPSYNDIEINFPINTGRNEEISNTVLLQNDVSEDNVQKDDVLPPPPYRTL